MERVTKRVIGDNANMIRKFPAMEGRIYAIAFAPDGKSFAAGSSLDGTGAVNFYNYDFNTEMPADILAIEDKAHAAHGLQHAIERNFPILLMIYVNKSDSEHKHR